MSANPKAATLSILRRFFRDERAIHLERPLVRTHRESTASKTDTPLFISLALCPFGKPVWMNLACRPLRSEATTPTRFSARRSSRSLFCSMEYPIDRLDGELFGIVFVTHPFEEFFVLRMTRIL